MTVCHAVNLCVYNLQNVGHAPDWCCSVFTRNIRVLLTNQRLETELFAKQCNNNIRNTEVNFAKVLLQLTLLVR